MLVELLTVKADAFVPPKLTELTSLKFVPVMVTLTPFPALVGVKEVMVGGAGIIVNHARDAVPVGDTTVTLPELVPVATVAVMLVAEFTVNDAAATPPKLTAVVPVKLVPVIVTIVPAVPLTGVKEIIEGPV